MPVEREVDTKSKNIYDWMAKIFEIKISRVGRNNSLNEEIIILIFI